jgi:hypothetical protein
MMSSTGERSPLQALQRLRWRSAKQQESVRAGDVHAARRSIDLVMAGRKVAPLLFLLTSIACAQASAAPSPGAVPLAANGKAATLVVEGTAWAGLIRAAHDLAEDIHAVTGLTPNFGETLGAMEVFPVLSPSTPLGQRGISLDYHMHLFNSGEHTLELITAPTLNFVPGRGLRLAVSLDDGPLQIVDTLAHNPAPLEHRSGSGGRENRLNLRTRESQLSRPPGKPSYDVPGGKFLEYAGCSMSRF